MVAEFVRRRVFARHERKVERRWCGGIGVATMYLSLSLFANITIPRAKLHICGCPLFYDDKRIDTPSDSRSVPAAISSTRQGGETLRNTRCRRRVRGGRRSAFLLAAITERTNRSRRGVREEVTRERAVRETASDPPPLP